MAADQHNPAPRNRGHGCLSLRADAIVGRCKSAFSARVFEPPDSDHPARRNRRVPDRPAAGNPAAVNPLDLDPFDPQRRDGPGRGPRSTDQPSPSGRDSNIRPRGSTSTLPPTKPDPLPTLYPPYRTVNCEQ
jgi:hypothetical protein